MGVKEYSEDINNVKNGGCTARSRAPPPPRDGPTAVGAGGRQGRLPRARARRRRAAPGCTQRPRWAAARREEPRLEPQAMLATAALGGAVLALLLLLQWVAMRNTRAARLTAAIPGPTPLPLLGNVLEFGFTPVDILINASRLCNKYGYLIKGWLGPFLYVFIGEPKYSEIFLTSTVNISKNYNYTFLHPWLGTGLLTSTGAKWKHHRKILTPTFHFKILEEFIDVFNATGNILIKKLKERPEGDTDIYEHMNLYALDVMCEAAMGVQMNVQENQNSEYCKAVARFSDILVKRSLSPWLFPDFTFTRSALGKEQKECVRVLHNMSNKVIASRKKELELKENEVNQNRPEDDVGQKKRLAFLDQLLKHNREGGTLTDEDIREEVDTFMFEGHDTTASGLSFTLWLLAQNEECQEKAYEELLDIFGDSDRELNAEDLANMKYLECIIKESLRLYPSVPFIFRTLDEEVKLGENVLLPGCMVLLSPFYMHRHPEHFPDPEKFDPERFTAENVRGRHPYAYVPFSAGPRNCIGQKFAMMEMKCIISKILRNFKLSPSNKQLVLSYEIILRSHGGIYVKLQNRR